jgi:hypothetical protein
MGIAPTVAVFVFVGRPPGVDPTLFSFSVGTGSFIARSVFGFRWGDPVWSPYNLGFTLLAFSSNLGHPQGDAPTKSLFSIYDATFFLVVGADF